MRKIEYNCGYEELLAIAMMQNISLDEKVSMAIKGVTYSQAQQMLGPNM